jgi:hypothetical protein
VVLSSASARVVIVDNAIAARHAGRKRGENSSSQQVVATRHRIEEGTRIAVVRGLTANVNDRRL